MEASKIKELYAAVLKKDWKTLEEELSKETDSVRLLSPVSVHKDNIIHLAVHSKKKEPLEKILKSIKSDMLPALTTSVNAYGNTVLHEAATYNNFEAVKLLVDKNNNLLEMKNDSGETPLFRAAAIGNTKIVKFLAAQQGERVIDSNGKVQLKSIHRNQKDGRSILSVAVQARNFGTALELLKLDETLAELKDKSRTSLYILSTFPSVFMSKYEMGWWKRIFYFCVPIGSGLDDTTEKIIEDKYPDIEKALREGLPTGSGCEIEVENRKGGRIYKRLYKINLSVWDKLFGWSVVHNLWEEKRDFVLASELAWKLIKKDESWDQSEMQFSNGDRPPEVENEEKGVEKSRNPLFSAIRTGNVKLVELILEQHPQAFECINRKKQNILHMAVKYRQKKIFHFLKQKEIPLLRLAQQIDSKGYTILHSVADTTYYRRKTTVPVYLLQEELEWFHNVKDIMPSHHCTLPANNDMTPWEVFVEHHDEQYKEAQQWVHRWCTALAASAVFAAAFAVPGDTSENVHPTLLNSPFFLLYVFATVLALASSLTAVVIFLVIVTSPLELKNFRRALPKGLTHGSALVVVSGALSLLAKASTIFVVISDQHLQWSMILVSSVAFFPLCVFVLTRFRWVDSFMEVCSFFLKFALRFCINLKNLVHCQKPRES